MVQLKSPREQGAGVEPPPPPPPEEPMPNNMPPPPPPEEYNGNPLSRIPMHQQLEQIARAPPETKAAEILRRDFPRFRSKLRTYTFFHYLFISIITVFQVVSAFIFAAQILQPKYKGNLQLLGLLANVISAVFIQIHNKLKMKEKMIRYKYIVNRLKIIQYKIMLNTITTQKLEEEITKIYSIEYKREMYKDSRRGPIDPLPQRDPLSPAGPAEIP